MIDSLSLTKFHIRLSPLYLHPRENGNTAVSRLGFPLIFQSACFKEDSQHELNGLLLLLSANKFLNSFVR